MEGHQGNESGDRPSSRTAIAHRFNSTPALEILSLHNQLLHLENRSSVPSYPYDIQALESGIARFDLSRSDNRRPPLFNGDYANGSLINNYLINNQRVSGSGFFNGDPYTLQETESRRISHLQRPVPQNISIQTSHGGFLNNPRDVSFSSRDGFLDRRTWYAPNDYLTNNVLRDNIMSRRSHNDGRVYSLDSIPFKNLRGKILSLAKDRYFSHFLQQIMVEDSGKKTNMIFDEVIGNIGELMVDPCGHHVFQKLLEKCSDEQITQILFMVTRTSYPDLQSFQLVQICTNSYGSRAMQALLKSLKSQKQISYVMGVLSAIAVPLTKSNNGHRLIQYCLEHFSPEDNMSFVEIVAQNCYKIAIDQHGCNALQYYIAYCDGELRQRLVGEIIDNSLTLSDHHNGNYVVQYMLELRDPRITGEILRRLKGNYGFLSRDKYGSRVVQRCLTESGEEHSTRIITELLCDINLLLIDCFGNYVMQSALEVAKGEVRGILMHYIRENSSMMRNNMYGKKVIEKLKHL